MLRRFMLHGLIVALGSAVLALSGCGGDSNNNNHKVATGGDVIGTSSTASADLTEIADGVAAVLALGYNTTNPDALAKNLFDGNPDNDPFIIDTREPADYAAGHIPGAVNIPLQQLAQALLNGTSGIPADREVIVASYWGNDGNMGSFLVNVARIADPEAQKAATAAKTPLPYPKSTGLFQGMTSWNFRRELVPAGTRFDDALAAGVTVEKATQTEPVAGTEKGLYPNFSKFPTDADSTIKKILIRADKYLNSVPTQFDLQVYPATLAANLEDGDPSNDPQVVSVRAGSAYAQGHIPGSINIAYQQVANLPNAELMDPTKPVVAYCYTGHTGSLSTIALGILGYPVKNLLYGINGWSTDSAISSGQLKNFDLMKGWDFPVNDGGDGDLVSLGDYVPPTGCVECHTSLTAIFYDREVADIPEGAVEVPSEGEG